MRAEDYEPPNGLDSCQVVKGRGPSSVHDGVYIRGKSMSSERNLPSQSKIDRVNEGSITGSKARTSSIAAAIRSNVTRRLVVDEYLKYETKIYDFAVRLHHAQHSRIQKKLMLLSQS